MIGRLILAIPLLLYIILGIIMYLITKPIEIIWKKL